MIQLRLGPLEEEKPVRLTLELPAEVFRDLTAYAEAHARSTGQPGATPARLIVPMLVHFMAADRGFAKLRRSAGKAAG